MKERLKESRLKCGFTQKYVALSLGVSLPIVSQWESGIKNPTVDNLIRLADLFGCTVDYLIGRNNDAPQVPVQEITPNERHMLDTYRSLSPQGKEYVRQQLDIAARLYAGDGQSSDVSNVANQ